MSEEMKTIQDQNIDVKDQSQNSNINNDTVDNQDNGGTQKSLDDILKDYNLLDEFQTRLQREADRRVTEAIKKTEKKLKEQFKKEREKEKMTEEERLEAERKEREREIQRKLREATIKELKYELVDVLTSEGMDLGFKDLIDVSQLLNIEDEEERKETLVNQVKSMKEIVDKLVDKKVEDFKKEYLKGNTPQNLGKGRESNTPPNEYEKAKKLGDVKTMIGLKFADKFRG